MRAIRVEALCEPADLRVGEAPEPELRAGTLLVDVKAAGCNFSDILMCRGKYQVAPELPFIPGVEAAGVVAGVGAGVTGFAPGDRVLCSPGLGCFAERVVVPAEGAHRLPPGMSFEHGAALPIIYATSYAGLVFRAALQPGETLLVHAAAGGVGTAAVQIGKALGARVIATVGGADKLEVARACGADVALDYREEDFVARVLSETGERGADVIYDPVGGDVFDRSLKCIAWNGRLVVIGFASGRIPTVEANRILLKNIAVTGLHWPAYATHEPERIAETFEALFGLHTAGGIAPVIHGSFPLEEAAAALVALASRKTSGKLLLVP